jgi:hypothetical protein
VSINITIKCDDCHGLINDGEPVYCASCWEGAEKMLEDKDALIESLKDEIGNLKDIIDELHQQPE